MGRDSLTEAVRAASHPLGGPEDLDPLLARVANARVVLMGEASHGTSEFYRWRDLITRRLVEEHGFHFVAVEGDWPDCYLVNRYVKGLPAGADTARGVLHAFSRWPTWMWANEEVVEAAEWLRGFNDARPEADRVGFYGLDVYSLWDSMEVVTRYLDRVDPEAASRARRGYGCFDPYQDDVQEYALASMIVPSTCEDEVVGILRELRERGPDLGDDSREAFFNAEQNALVARNAERYYRTMLRGGAASWNVRDQHMMETLEQLMAHHGPEARGIVWEHNTHVGDARATDMARAGMTNVGQLARERWGDEAAIVGFSSYEGTVVAGEEWGAPMRVMRVPPARAGSWEEILHRAGEGEDRIVLLERLDEVPEALDARGHRAIGVVYHPDAERFGNYVPSVLPYRYDVLVHIDRSRAVRPLHLAEQPAHEPPETYPSGE